MNRRRAAVLASVGLLSWGADVVGVRGAQTVTGQVIGSVTDTTGGVIPGVTVRVSSVTSSTLSTVTDQAGRFRIEHVPSGRQQVTAQLAGFRTTRVDVDVPAGGAAVVTMVVQIGIMTKGDLYVTPDSWSAFITTSQVVAHVRIRDAGQQRLVGSTIATDYLADVLAVIKASAGSGNVPVLRFFNAFDGTVIDEGRTYVGEAPPYQVGDEFIGFFGMNDKRSSDLWARYPTNVLHLKVVAGSVEARVPAGLPLLSGSVADVMARLRAYGTMGGSARAVDVRRR